MDKIKVVYLAGPLRGGVFKKIIYMREAKRAAKTLWMNNIAVISPHKNSGWLDTHKTDKFLLPANIELMRRCDALVLLPGWEKSKGTIAELEVALEMGLPIYFDRNVAIHCLHTGQVHPFVKKAKEVIERLKKEGNL